MPAHIGFLETFKMGLNSLTTNISPSSTSRRARSALANQRQNLRGQAQGLAVGVPDPVQQFGDSLLSLSDVQNRLERNRSGREHRCNSYEAYRSYLDNRSPYLERDRNATVHADYISKPEWNMYLDEQTWFDTAMHALFLVPGGFYALLIARKSDQYQLKRIEGTESGRHRDHVVVRGRLPGPQCADWPVRRVGGVGPGMTVAAVGQPLAG